MKELLEKLVAEVRGHVIYSKYMPGIHGDKPVAEGCELCKSEWPPGAPEVHIGACLIAMTDVAIEQLP